MHLRGSIKAWRYMIAMAAAFFTAAVGGLSGLDPWAIGALVCVILAGWLYLDLRSAFGSKPDSGEWQRRIDHEYELRIAEDAITLFRHKEVIAEFLWRDVIEVQKLSRSEFPPLVWKIIGKHGVFELPIGGRYANEFERRFVYSLPDYRAQRVVEILAPGGFCEAHSMWRKSDPYPKVVPYSDWD